MSAWRSEVIARLEMPALAALWERASHPLPFNHPGFSAAAITAYGRRRRLLVPQLWHGGQLIAAWPLWRKRMGPKDALARIVEPIGARHADYCAPLIAAGVPVAPAIEALLAVLLPRLAADTMLLWPKAPAGLGAAARLAAVCGSGGWHAHAHTRRCPAMRLATDWPAMEARWSKSHRGDLRRQERRLAQLGTVQLVRCHDRREIAGRLPLLAAMHRAEWQSRGHASEFARPHAARFLAGLAAGLPAASLHHAELRLDGRPIAIALFFQAGGALLNYKSAYDPAFAAYSPAKVMLALMTRSAVAGGLQLLDFMQGEEPYKATWCDTQQETHTVALARRGHAPLWWWNVTRRRLLVEYKA